MTALGIGQHGNSLTKPGNISRIDYFFQLVPRYVPRFCVGCQYLPLYVSAAKLIDLPMKKTSKYRYLEAFVFYAGGAGGI